MNAGERVREARLRSGLSQKALGSKVGVSASAVSLWETGETSLTGKHLLQCAKVLGMNAEFLLGMDEGKRAVKIETPSSVATVGTNDRIAMIPYYGRDATEEGLILQRDWLVQKGINVEQSRMIVAPGNSMAPTIADGCIVMIDTSKKDLQNGKVFACLIYGEAQIKRVFRSLSGEWRLASDNQNKILYPDETVPPGVSVEVIGQCVWQAGDL